MLNYLKGIRQAWIDYPEPEGRLLAGTYEIVRSLGSGSYGLAYRCRDIRTGEHVVVKQSKPSKGELAERLLERETELLSGLKHPGIPGFRGSFRHRNRLCIAIDLIEGHTIEDLLFEQERPFSELESLRWIAKLMEIVGYVHDQGIVHLDVRIPNVILREERLYLIDFGLAKRIGEEAAESYADEELRKRRTPEVRSDLYAVGHLLLFLLYSSYQERPGQPPADWQEELAVSGDVKHIIRRLLQVEPPYADTESFRFELDNTLQRLQNAAGANQELE
ncbi:putative serine/threonine-protein kinase YbdM [Paenibacillus tyrfis]|uniref:serine/threonine protein kinase n=1 Tax=Paenibacillus tyrfis TaxID=1501230 RepID=UPI00248FE814|nr:protein kinase [Paenibacillus tyrfis]GLI08477.1 putative serine/threonine-protein kinase YbdM [Paenibacillus tyrfis]